MIDLDALEAAMVSDERFLIRTHKGDYSSALIDRLTLETLIAELRAARPVVEAVREYRAIGGVRVIYDALEVHDAVTKEGT